LNDFAKENKKEFGLSAVSSNYRPPSEPVMGPVNYPPATAGKQQTSDVTLNTEGIQTRLSKVKAEDMFSTNMWNLPSAQVTQGAMLVLPYDIGLYEDVFARWESITLNTVDHPNMIWRTNQQKMQYMESLLGEDEKKVWIQWRMAYEEDYKALVEMADDTQNVISQIRRVLFLEDPYQGSTEEQDRAYNDLERLTCEKPKDILNYLNQFKKLAAKSGRMYFEETTEKLFRKMPPLIGNDVRRLWYEKHPATTAAVMPVIRFTFQYLKKMETEL